MENIHRWSHNDGFHPNRMGHLFWVPTSNAAALVAAVAENALLAGTVLTLLPAADPGMVVASPCSICFTPSAAVTIVVRIAGVDQFGRPQTEDVTIAAAAVQSLYCYGRIVSLTIVSTGVSANTLSVGYILTAGFRVAIPWAVKDGQQTRVLGTEVLGVITAAGIAPLAIAAGAIDTKRSTYTLNATITAGAALMKCAIQMLGVRRV